MSQSFESTAATAPAGVVSTPHVEGPIAVTGQSQAFLGVSLPTGRGALHGLEVGKSEAPPQYTEEEFFISHEAAGARYRTHMLIRRPADPNAFSGTVFVEPMHVSGPFPIWMFKEYIVSRGHGWAGVGAQNFPLEKIVKPFASARYGSLFIEDPKDSNSASTPPAAGPPSSESAEMAAMVRAAMRQKPVAQAILAQAGALLKDKHASPFGSRVQNVILGGVSQTGLLCLDFICEAHDRLRLGNGASVFDGYFPVSAPGARPVPAVRVPVVHMPNEGDFLMAKTMGRVGGLDTVFNKDPFAYRREDSDSEQDRYRLYELAGCAHVPTWHVSAGEFSGIPGLAEAVRSDERLSQFPGIMYRAAALHSLVRWLTDGTPPPRAARMNVADGEIVRDEHGNALGGVRSSHLDVPIATYITRAPDSGAEVNLRRAQLGIEIPFSPEKLARMYGSSQVYAKRVKAKLDDLVRERWLLPEDAALLAAEAETVPIG